MVVAMDDADFDYERAFDRNIGWVTADEQQTLRTKRVAIAGMGGVGGVHLLTLARMGIGAFNISDLDSFELANFNRQAGAAVSTLDRPKVEVMAEMAKDINPLLDVVSFPDGIKESNIDAFLKDVDLFVDGFDFFVPTSGPRSSAAAASSAFRRSPPGRSGSGPATSFSCRAR